MLLSKMQTYLSEKMPLPPQKKIVKLKNEKMGLSTIRKHFFNFNLFGAAFCHKDKFAFWKSA
jgi:hypothetical protein